MRMRKKEQKNEERQREKLCFSSYHLHFHSEPNLTVFVKNGFLPRYNRLHTVIALTDYYRC